MKIINLIRSFKKIKSTDKALDMGLYFRTNVYGDGINELNCRSLWVDKYFIEYRCDELYWEIGERVVCNHGYLRGQIGKIVINDGDGSVFISIDNSSNRSDEWIPKMTWVNKNKITRYEDWFGKEWAQQKIEKDKRREELRLKYIHIDPYGEENWEE